MSNHSESSPYSVPVTRETRRRSRNISKFVSSLAELDDRVIWEIMGEAASHQQHQALIHNEDAKSDRSHQMFALQAHKSAQRIARAARQISTDYHRQDITISLDEIIENRSSFGLEVRDIKNIENWISIKFGYSDSSEQQYGVTRIDQFRKYIAVEHLEKGASGTMLCFDLAGLKIFNSSGEEAGVGHDYGDAALKGVADFLRSVVSEIINSDSSNEEKGNRTVDPTHFIGRKGDEFYVFIPDLSPDEVVPKINQAYQQAVNEQSLDVEVNGSTMTANCYWRATQISNIEELNHKIVKLDTAIEEAKTKAINDYIKQVESQEAHDIIKLALLIQSLRDKRIPESLITASIFTGFEVLKELIAEDSPDKVSVELSQLIELNNNPVIRNKAKEITRAVLLKEEKGGTLSRII